MARPRRTNSLARRNEVQQLPPGTGLPIAILDLGKFLPYLALPNALRILPGHHRYNDFGEAGLVEKITTGVNYVAKMTQVARGNLFSGFLSLPLALFAPVQDSVIPARTQQKPRTEDVLKQPRNININIERITGNGIADQRDRSR